MVVVTRYFGGTLLGTGGLVRAYSAATKTGIENSVVTDRCKGKKIELKTDYNGLGKIQYIMGEMDIPILDTVYTDMVGIIAVLPNALYDSFKKKLTEATAGKGLWEEEEDVEYIRIEKEVILVH